MFIKATLSLEASYYNDRLSNWEPLVENCMQQEDVYRPWLLTVWFAMEPGGILQPPLDQKGIPSMDFPIQDLDYSPLYSSELVVQNNSSTSRLEHVPSESIFSDETSAKSSKLNKLNKKQLKQKMKQKKAQPNLDQLEDADEEKKTITTPIASYLLIESNDILNLNVTPSAYRVIMYLAQITAGTSNQDFLENKVKPPLKFLNFLGEKCDLILASSLYLENENAVGFNLISDKQQVKDEQSGNVIILILNYN